MYQRFFVLIFWVIMGFPATAQDAGPLELDPGMRAYTTRFFVEPKVLAELSVGDEVSFYVTYFTAWDYPHTEGFEDTYVVNSVLDTTARILAITQSDIGRVKDPLVEVIVRLEASREDMWFFLRADNMKAGRSYYEESIGRAPFFLMSGDPLIMVKRNGGLPEFCPACRTILFEEYVSEFVADIEHCFLTVRRGVRVEQRVIPCRED